MGHQFTSINAIIDSPDTSINVNVDRLPFTSTNVNVDRLPFTSTNVIVDRFPSSHPPT